MAQIYSELHQNIQDRFNEAGVEIMSPHYAAMRDGNQTAMPADHLPPSYEAPAFRVQGVGGVLRQAFRGGTPSSQATGLSDQSETATS
jgi:hypothetical protein